MYGQTFPACVRGRCVSFDAPRNWTQRLENVAAVRNLLGFHRRWVRARELRYAALVSILDDYDAHKPRRSVLAWLRKDHHLVYHNRGGYYASPDSSEVKGGRPPLRVCAF